MQNKRNATRGQKQDRTNVAGVVGVSQTLRENRFTLCLNGKNVTLSNNGIAKVGKIVNVGENRLEAVVVTDKPIKRFTVNEKTITTHKPTSTQPAGTAKRLTFQAIIGVDSSTTAKDAKTMKTTAPKNTVRLIVFDKKTMSITIYTIALIEKKGEFFLVATTATAQCFKKENKVRCLLHEHTCEALGLNIGALLDELVPTEDIASLKALSEKEETLENILLATLTEKTDKLYADRGVIASSNPGLGEFVMMTNKGAVKFGWPEFRTPSERFFIPQIGLITEFGLKEGVNEVEFVKVAKEEVVEETV